MDLSLFGIVLVITAYLLITFKACNLFIFHSLNIIGSLILVVFSYQKGLYAYTFFNSFMVVAGVIFLIKLPNEKQRKQKAKLKILKLKEQYPDLKDL